MYIIDQTYFQKELFIPNLNEMDSDVSSDLDIDIDKYVRSLLRDALGLDLFKDLDSNIVNGALKEDALDKWKDLVNGIEYIKNGINYKWGGLIQTEGSFKNSLLAKYVYFFWLRDSVSKLTGVGEKRIEATNAVSVNSSQRLVSIWNSFIEDYQGQTLVPSPYSCFDTYTWEDDGFVSLIQFISDNATDYPNPALRTFSPMNQLGL